MRNRSHASRPHRVAIGTLTAGSVLALASSAWLHPSVHVSRVPPSGATYRTMSVHLSDGFLIAEYFALHPQNSFSSISRGWHASMTRVQPFPPVQRSWIGLPRFYPNGGGSRGPYQRLEFPITYMAAVLLGCAAWLRFAPLHAPSYQCPQCGYDRSGLMKAPCPECGHTKPAP